MPSDKFYTVRLSGNIAGFPVAQEIINATKVVHDKDSGKLKLVVEGTSLYLSPQPHENIQVISQPRKLTEDDNPSERKVNVTAETE